MILSSSNSCSSEYHDAAPAKKEPDIHRVVGVSAGGREGRGGKGGESERDGVLPLRWSTGWSLRQGRAPSSGNMSTDRHCCARSATRRAGCVARVGASAVYSRSYRVVLTRCASLDRPFRTLVLQDASSFSEDALPRGRRGGGEGPHSEAPACSQERIAPERIGA